jgi:hypothetical protein
MIPWFSMLALAAAPAEYPLSATVTMPEQGVVAVRVPPQLRSADDPDDGTDLLLLDATGAAVPFALVARAADAWTERVAVDVAATPDPDVWTLELGSIPLDGLVVDLPPSVRSAEVIVEDLGGKRLGDPTLVWRTPGSASDHVSFTPATGPVQVKVQVKAGTDDGRGPGFVGLRRVKGGVPSDRITVPVGPPVIQENGYTRYVADLERAMPVDRVRVVTDAEVFERTASIEPWRWYDARPDALDLEPSPSTAQRIVRTGPDQEMTVLSGPTPPADRLVLLLGTDGKAPLPVSALELEFDAVQLLVQDPGPGPHTLYAGARAGTSPHWDLEVAAPELARREPVVVEPMAIGPNPAWVPPEVRAELVGLGPEVPHTGWARWERPIEAEGAVRIPLPADVLALSRPDLGDLRVVSGSQQVPYVLRRRPIDQPLTVGEPERTEVGGRSRIRVPLPQDGPPIAAITLTTSATVFERQVVVSRAAGANLETLRAVPWVGTERPGRLTVSMDRRVAGELLIEIDNGDDPPLPVDDITVTVQGWELVAVVPAGSVLRYGDPSLWPPSYDLALMEDELRRRPMPEATLGAAISAGRTPLSMLDRFLMAIGVGVLGVGLALLAADLLRRTTPPAEPDEAGEPAFEGDKVTAEAEAEPAKVG